MLLHGVIALVFAVSVSVGAAHAEAATPFEIEIQRQHFSVDRDYVTSAVPNGKREKAQLWVSFSVPSFAAVGTLFQAREIVAQKKKALRTAGEDIIEMKLEPDEGRVLRPQRAVVESYCSKLGRFEGILESGVSGYSCSMSNGDVAVRVFHIVASSGDATLRCNYVRKTPEGRPLDHCELIAGGRSDGISRTLLVDRDSVPKLPAWLDAAEKFIQEKMKPD